MEPVLTALVGAAVASAVAVLAFRGWLRLRGAPFAPVAEPWLAAATVVLAAPPFLAVAALLPAALPSYLLALVAAGAASAELVVRLCREGSATFNGRLVAWHERLLDACPAWLGPPLLLVEALVLARLAWWAAAAAVGGPTAPLAPPSTLLEWLVPVLLVPVGETLALQLVPLELLRRAGASAGAAHAMSWALFALLHLAVNGVVNAASAGLVAGWVFALCYGYHRRSSTARAVAATAAVHAAYNLVVYLVAR